MANLSPDTVSRGRHLDSVQSPLQNLPSTHGPPAILVVGFLRVPLRVLNGFRGLSWHWNYRVLLTLLATIQEGFWWLAVASLDFGDVAAS